MRQVALLLASKCRTWSLSGSTAVAFAVVAAMWSAEIGNGWAQPATSASYPAPGHTYQIEFGALAFKNEFNADGKQMTFTRLSDGRTGTVQYTAVEIRPNLFWTHWTESDGTSVARIEDYERETVHAVVHFHDGKVLSLNGTFRKLQ